MAQALPVVVASKPVALLILIALAALQLSVMPVSAGTQALPEITDPANDQAVEGTVPISQQPPPGTTSVGLNSDLVAGWIDGDTATSLMFNIQLQGTGNPTSSSTTTWTFHFETGGKSYDATAKQEIANQQGTGQPGSGAINPGGAASSAVANGDGLIHLTVLKSAIGNPVAGAILTNLFMTAEGKQGGVVPNGVTDRAPNTGAGTNYVIAGASAAPGPQVIRAKLDTATLSIQQAFTAQTNATYLYNWTQGPKESHLTVSVLAAHGTATIRILDAANKTLYERLAAGAPSADVNLSGTAGVWTIQVGYASFTGNVTIAIGPQATTQSTGSASGSSTTTGPTSNPASGSASQSATLTSSTLSSGTTSTKASPAVAWFGLLVVVGAAAILRRRVA